MGTDLQLILIARNPELARMACDAGVNRIMVDLETLGKRERQRTRDTIISDHRPEDVALLRPAVPPGALVTRINPLYDGSSGEIESAVAAGTDYLMLPMFRTAEEAGRFIELVRGRARTMLLLETREARDNLEAILRVPGIDEIYVGLNDLSMALGMPFLFQVLTEGIIDEMAPKLRKAGIRFGFGGVGRMGGKPLPGELIIAEHKRVGSELVILSRVFHGDSKTVADLKRNGIDLPEEVARVRRVEQHASYRTPDQIESDRCAAQRIVETIVQRIPAASA